MEVGDVGVCQKVKRADERRGCEKREVTGLQKLTGGEIQTCSCIIYSDDNGGGASGPLGVGPATSVPDEAKVVGNRILSPNVSWKRRNEGCDPTVEG